MHLFLSLSGCHEGTSVACGPNPLVTPAVPDLGYFECSKKTGAVDETLAILFEPGCLFNTTLSFGCSGGTVTYDVYAGVGCTGGIKKSYSATADGTCDKVWGGAWDCEMGQKFQLSSASQMIAGAWSTMVMAIVLGSRAL